MWVFSLDWLTVRGIHEHQQERIRLAAGRRWQQEVDCCYNTASEPNALPYGSIVQVRSLRQSNRYEIVYLMCCIMRASSNHGNMEGSGGTSLAVSAFVTQCVTRPYTPHVNWASFASLRPPSRLGSVSTSLCHHPNKMYCKNIHGLILCCRRQIKLHVEC